MMEYPQQDNLSDFPGSIQWYPDTLPYPVCAAEHTMTTPEQRQQGSLRNEFHCRLFDLSDEESQQIYIQIKDRTVAGWYRITEEMKRWREDGKGVQVWLEWVQTYVVPDARQQEF